MSFVWQSVSELMITNIDMPLKVNSWKTVDDQQKH